VLWSTYVFIIITSGALFSTAVNRVHGPG